MSFSGLLIHKCDIYRPVESDGIYGEKILSSETLIKANEACRFAEKQERRIFDSVSADAVVTRYLLLVPSGSSLQERDIVRNVELDSSTTITGPFLVEKFHNRFSTYLHHKSATIRLIDQ